MDSAIAITIDAPTAAARERAAGLAASLELPLAALDDPGFPLALVVTGARLELREVGQKTGPVYVDFVAGRTAARRKQGGLAGDLLVKAIGRKTERWAVWDVTAGLGRDAFLLAASGCRVTMVERSPVCAALLEDGLVRAMQDSQVQGLLGGRLTLRKGDARHLLAAIPETARPDAVYIDPMFPLRAKAALSKKEMRLLRLVAGEDADAAELFEVARATARHRVVVKRWLHAPPIGPGASIQYKGRSIRYDVHLSR